MKKRVLLIFASVLIAFLFLNVVEARTINCRNDMNCFIENSVNCTRSKVEFKQSVDFFGMIVNVTTNMNIKEERDGRCKLFIQHKTSKFYFDDWVVDDLISQGYSLREIRMAERSVNTEAKKLITGRGICKFEKGDLTELLTKWNNETSSSEDFDKGECSGKIFEGVI